MNTMTKKQLKWFWPWQDEKEEAWLESMSQAGWHLSDVQIPCAYSFTQGEPRRFIYRLDYQLVDRSKKPEYLQLFQDAGWDHLGEMSNWQYWRKPYMAGETVEIFTDRESKLKKYQRMLGYMAIFLVLMVFLGSNMIRGWRWSENLPWLINAIYLAGVVCYVVIIPIYVVVVMQLLRRIKQLKKKSV